VHPDVVQPPVHFPAPSRKASQTTQPKSKDSQKPDSTVRSAENSGTQTPPAKTCSLQGALDEYLRQAEYARGHGDYPSAERLFSRVLECDPNNNVAKVGLSRTKAAQN
jgi:hypothetical protein